MPDGIRLYNGKILISGGAVAVSDDCCCDIPATIDGCCGDAMPGVMTVHIASGWVADMCDACADVSGEYQVVWHPDSAAGCEWVYCGEPSCSFVMDGNDMVLLFYIVLRVNPIGSNWELTIGMLLYSMNGLVSQGDCGHTYARGYCDSVAHYHSDTVTDCEPSEQTWVLQTEDHSGCPSDPDYGCTGSLGAVSVTR